MSLQAQRAESLLQIKLEAELNNESEAIETFSDSVAQDEPRSELEQMARRQRL